MKILRVDADPAALPSGNRAAAVRQGRQLARIRHHQHRNEVWIGHGAFIKPGVITGDGAVVAAGSVVTKNIPPYAIVGGVPARAIETRFPDRTIEKLLAVKWWQ